MVRKGTILKMCSVHISALKIHRFPFDCILRVLGTQLLIPQNGLQINWLQPQKMRVIRSKNPPGTKSTISSPETNHSRFKEHVT